MPIIAAVDTDGHSETVLREAAKLTDAFEQELHVIHVLSRSAFVSLERTSVEDTGEGIDPTEIRRIAEETVVELVENADVEAAYTPVGLVGEAADEIVRYASEHDAEYIVLSGRQRSPVGKALFGSVTQSVLLNAPCPVVSAITQSTEESAVE